MGSTLLMTEHEPGLRFARLPPRAVHGNAATKPPSLPLPSRSSTRVQEASWSGLSPSTICARRDRPLVRVSSVSRPTPRLRWAAARSWSALSQDGLHDRRRKSAAARVSDAHGYSSESSSSLLSSTSSASWDRVSQSSTTSSQSSLRRPGFRTFLATTSPRLSS
jgi:hypothetical protein